ncbi:peroxisome biogenesis factor 10-like [Anoplophora glabripennis]|uniref:peroxisome biogenesis factor 10-like n=1 Tax=Anoplophora glabripennis TaxID=217634 RepID=UPI0008759551|nr:peroxisome biogenesis factor 10-like [Anoplophora glabripennis]
MPLHMHPIVLGCILVVTVGTAMYTYITTRQQDQKYSYGSSNRSRQCSFEDISRASSCSTISDDSKQSSRKRKRDKCMVCLSSITTDSYALSCSHVFHFNCISKWLKENNTCPSCRQEPIFNLSLSTLKAKHL